MSRVWLEIEAFKREMRGIPRLSSHSVEELQRARALLAKRLDPSTRTSSFTEIEPDAAPQAKDESKVTHAPSE